MAVTQANREIRVTTPLGTDKLLIVEINGREALSQLFQYQLTLLAENATKVEFDKLIGQPITVEMDMPGKKKRFFNGICARLAEGRRDDDYTHYRMEVVPKFWLLTRRVQSRIFQQITVPDILKKVLAGLDVKWDIQGNFFERDYCVQYRESDFAFASRLMEEEGIYYYFTHSDKGHTLVVANTPQGHADVPEYAKAIYESVRGGTREEMRVTDWEKVQELRSGKVTLWDHCFELPQKNLEAQKTIQETVAVGKVTHKLKVADNDKLELYDFPGAYAQRFDGIDPGGGARADDLQKIFQDNARVAKLHIEREAVESLQIRGAGNCRQFGAGQKFTLERHFNGDGAYVITGLDFAARLAADFRTSQSEGLNYENRFTCIPLSLPFRPQLTTRKPTVGGTQTATVVGPPGETIFCDKYGRIKVQFHWDRLGKKDANSSCWVRVSQNWGGGEWGSMTIPHVGHEVIVDFEEGDPDCPLIVGRVYNAECMPPLTLPGHKTKTVFRDHGGNQIFMEGEAGKQSIVIASPNGGTSFTLGFRAPSIAPIGAGGPDYQKLASAIKAANAKTPAGQNVIVADQGEKPDLGAQGWYNPAGYLKSETLPAGINVFSQGEWTSHIQGDYGTVNEQNTTGTYLGTVKNLYANDVYTECWTNNDTIVNGNYTCRVDGYQEYFTKGHYSTKVVGANWVTIVGADTDIYISAQQILNTGSQFELQLSKKLFKTPDEGSTYVRLRESIKDAKKDITRLLEKYKIKKLKSNMSEEEMKQHKETVEKYKGAIDTLLYEGGKATYNFTGRWLGKAGSAIWNAPFELKKKWKGPNTKDKG